jgi:hypothetical protein
MKLHEYQKKGVAKKAFRKWLILKGEDRGCFRHAGDESVL